MSPDSDYLEELCQQIALITELLQRIHAQLNLTPPKSVSPYIPLEEAAERLHYSSPERLKAEICRDEIPKQFVRFTTGPKAMRRRYFVDADGYISHLRTKGSR